MTPSAPSGRKPGPEGRGPKEWFLRFMEERASRLGPIGQKTEGPPGLEKLSSTLLPGLKGNLAFAPQRSTFWQDAILEFHKRRQGSRTRGKRPNGPGEPGVLGQSNWVPIGPSIIRKGQAGGRPGMSGRIARIAIAPGGSTVYVATALGGVWRSDDGGATWNTNEDSFDIDPTAFGATSLCCGAIAIDPASPNRVYAGTGEGDVSDIFSQRFLSYLPCYRGVGPVRSDDGGSTWHTEAIAAGSPSLAGQSFYELAVDPGDRDNVVGATSAGLYHREPDGIGGYQWAQVRTGVHSDVVAARSGSTTTFFAAAWGDQVYSSPDGTTWTAVGTGFPSGATRISLALRSTDPSVLYALVADSGFNLLGLYRLDGGAGAWKLVSGTPSFLGGQADYTCAIAVDPNDATTVYLGAGSTFAGSEWSGTVYRGSITPGGSAYSMTSTYIGGSVHGDIHHLVLAPGDSNTLWLGSDGGAFLSINPKAASPSFTQENVGLATLAMNYFSQHPSQPAVIFCGAQDNGTSRYTGEEAWLEVVEADGGYCVVNWNDPYKVIIFQNGSVQLTTNGGSSFTGVTPPGYSWVSGIMAPPIGGAPPSGTPADAGVIMLGADRPYLSTTFGSSWVTIPSGTSSDALPSLIFSVAFASASKAYVGTTGGQVYRYDLSGSTWSRTRIDNAAGGPLPLSGIVTKIAVDLADPSGNSIYITFGGSGDYRHVWHFNGTAWGSRSGPSAGAATALLDVEHNAIAVDPANTSTIFVGADIGVWKSTDGGTTWAVFSDGLPDAAVLDLKVHSTARLLRASTHGRSLFEIKLDPPASLDTELYVRDTDLDVGRTATTDYLPDPENQGQVVVHWESPNIKVDVPTPAGYQTPTTSLNFFQFVDVIQDGSGGVATLDPSAGTVTNRVYVEAHNRGIAEATSVKVMLLLCDASPHLPSLPAGYDANVRAGTAVGAPFTLVGVQTLTNLRVGVPQVAEFPLPSTILPPPASLPGDSHYCLLALLHSMQDQYTATQTNVDLLTVNERKGAQKNLHIVAFIGVPPPPSPWRWGAIQLQGLRDELLISDLVLEARGYGGRIGLVLPRTLSLEGAIEKSLVGFKLEKDGKSRDLVEDWQERQRMELKRCMKQGRFNFNKCKEMLAAMDHVVDQPFLLADPGAPAEIRGLKLEPGKSTTAFVVIQPPPNAKVGDEFRFRLLQRTHSTKKVLGGCTYSVQMQRPK
jgi:photosystem II stability/assembly factor-like uncharacterized protein